MVFGRPRGDFRTLERREHRWQALALSLVTGHASGVIDLVATGHQFVQRPLLGGQLLELGGLLLPLAQPGVVVGLGLDLHHDGHEAMVLATQFGALTTVDAGLLDAGPGFVDEARDSIALDRKGRHPPGVDHIGSGHQKAHLGAHRQYQRLVDFQQVVLTLGGLVMDLLGGGGQVAEELHILTQVFVVPLPLIAGDLDIDIRLTAVVDVDQGLGGRNGHGHQDQQGHHGPEDFHGGAFVELGRYLARGPTVQDHRPEHRAKHDDADHHTDPENGHVQVKHSVADFSSPWRHIRSPGGVRLAEYRPQQEAHPNVWMSRHCGFPFMFLVIPPVCTCGEGSGFHTAYNRQALPASCSWASSANCVQNRV